MVHKCPAGHREQGGVCKPRGGAVPRTVHYRLPAITCPLLDMGGYGTINSHIYHLPDICPVCVALPEPQGLDLPVHETGHSGCGCSPNAQAMYVIEGRIES